MRRIPFTRLAVISRHTLTNDAMSATATGSCGRGCDDEQDNALILAAPGGKDFVFGILDECRAVAAAEGYPPRAPALERATGMLTTEGSPLTASMFRDIKAGQPIEADHVIGDLIARADTAKVPVPRLRTAYTHLKAYEQTRG